MNEKTVSGAVECPECGTQIPVDDAVLNEFIQCPECLAEYEVISLEPLEIE